MRHNSDVRSFSRPFNQRKALIRGLVVNLVEHERIKTTVAKAKELRKVTEKSITLAKRGDLAARRLLISRLANEATVGKIMSVLAPRYKGRNGGYCRILRLVPRAGDNAPMALIEFIDAQLKGPSEKKTGTAGKKGSGKRSKAAKQSAGEKKAKVAKASGEKSDRAKAEGSDKGLKKGKKSSAKK